ncbi:MAG: 4Fe-4S dicluster domain-containing protein [Flavobacteriaceae bacterium]
MEFIPNIIFVIILVVSLGFFSRNVIRLKRNINLGKGQTDPITNKPERISNMLRIALGQSKMVTRPIPGILHLIVYLGFIIINIELIEILIDGIFGTHRVFSSTGGFYGFLIGSFEVFAVLVLIAVIAFWSRRNIIRIKRFSETKMMGWPKLDADLILYFEIILMSLFLLMNATDLEFQNMNNGNVISGYIYPYFSGYSEETLHLFERSFWWSHIIGIFIFLNYLYYSKHLHIILAFPNTYFASLSDMGKLNNMKSVTNEVNIMMGKSSESGINDDINFGASDVMDLSWLQLLNAYSCTECGRCTSVCPANITGKKLSPRKIMMDTRDRIEEVGNNIDTNGKYINDNKKLLGDYISEEELWACTSCNACVEECPISINPLSIIMDMRRNLVMEDSLAPSELNNMMSNIENNGAPWPYNQQDRLNWNE